MNTVSRYPELVQGWECLETDKCCHSEEFGPHPQVAYGCKFVKAQSERMKHLGF